MIENTLTLEEKKKAWKSCSLREEIQICTNLKDSSIQLVKNNHFQYPEATELFEPDVECQVKLERK